MEPMTPLREDASPEALPPDPPAPVATQSPEAMQRAREAVDRFTPGYGLTGLVFVGLCAYGSRAIMRWGNRLHVEGREILDRAKVRARAEGRGLLTFSNHVSLFDDPLLTACISDHSWHPLRWIATDALNFFDTPLKARIFSSGKCVPVIRGAGFEQPGMQFLAERLAEGEWIHVFPEGGRTRHPEARLQLPFKPGFARLVKETSPLVVPYYHRGMEQVLPIGAKLPAFGKSVSLLFGPCTDTAGDLAERPVEEITAWTQAQLAALQDQMDKRGERSRWN